MTIKDLGDLVIYVGAVVAALSAIGYFVYRVGVRPFVRWLRAELGATRQALGETQETTQAVHAEVTPNHGSSMKDSVERIEVTVARLDQRLTDHITDHPGGS